MKKLILPLLLLLTIGCAALGVRAQAGELSLDKGVAPHAGIDPIYKSFSDAYRTLDVEKVAGLYSESAAYLAPGNDIVLGREAIRPSFKSFFEWIKKENRTMTISFRIVQRKIAADLGYDVGVFTIRQFKDGQAVATGEGKFMVVAVREKDGRWRFQVDGYSDLKPAEKK